LSRARAQRQRAVVAIPVHCEGSDICTSYLYIAMRVNVTDLRQNLPTYLKRVQRGERIRVTSRGEVIAELAPPKASAEEAARARKRLRGSVVRYDRPLEPAVTPEEWSANR